MTTLSGGHSPVRHGPARSIGLRHATCGRREGQATVLWQCRSRPGRDRPAPGANGDSRAKSVNKRQHRLGEVEAVILSLHAQGVTTEEISAHLPEIYGASASKQSILRITDVASD